MALYGHRLRRVLSISSSFLNHHHNKPFSSLPNLFTTTLSLSCATQNSRSLNFPFQSRLFSSSTVPLLARYNNNFDDAEKIGPDTILFEGCDYNHWLITIDFPKDPKPTADEMVETYVQTAAKVVGSVEEAKKRIYACSTTTYQGFQLECTEEVSEKFKDVPGVVFVLPDSYIDPVNKEYGGDKYINGTIIPRPPPVRYDRPRNNNRSSGPRNFGPPRYPPPQQNYGPPGSQQNIHPRQNYGQPGAQQNIPLQQNYGPPGTHQNSPPQQNYGLPGVQQNSPSQQNYGPPGTHQNYGPPGLQKNIPPQQNYCQPGPQQNIPSQHNYGPRGAQQNSPPQQNYGLPGSQQNYGPPGTHQNYPPQQNYGPPGTGTRRDPMHSDQPNYNQGQPGNNYPQGQRDFLQEDHRGYAPPLKRDFRGDNQSYSPPQNGSYGQGFGGVQGQGMDAGYGQGDDQRFSQVDQGNNMQGEQRNYAGMGPAGREQGKY